MQEETKPIDWKKCLALANQNTEIAKLALTAFVDDLRENMAHAKESIEKKDLTAFRNYIHKLHGGSYYCGVPQLSKYLAELEMQLKKGADIEQLPELMTDVEQEAQRIFAAYTNHSYEDHS